MSVAPGLCRCGADGAIIDRGDPGSRHDYPHLSFADKVGSVELYKLYNLLGRWAPDDPTRQAILVDNPRSGSDAPDSAREKAERMLT